MNSTAKRDLKGRNAARTIYKENLVQLTLLEREMSSKETVDIPSLDCLHNSEQQATLLHVEAQRQHTYPQLDPLLMPSQN